MNSSKLFSLSFLTALLFFFISCGGNEEKTNTDSMSTDTTDMATTSTSNETSTVDRSASNVMVVRHKVSNFSKWLTSYEGHDSLRLANGIHSYVIGRGVEDSNMVMVAVKVDDLAKAKAFAKDASLKEAMKKGGVVGAPNIRFVTLNYSDTGASVSGLRSMTMFTVKDWETWQKTFESNRQIRTDNGLTDRAFGYDPEDNHKVTLVVAINDSAKATAFWNSDLIKQKRTESGVVDAMPERFVYQVVKRY